MIDNQKFDLVGLNEMPMHYLMRMAHANGKRQIQIVREYIQFCLIDPDQWNLVDSLNFEQFTNLVTGWLAGSSGVNMDFGDNNDRE